MKKKFHSSILKIKENFEYLDKFSTQLVTTDEMRREIFNLDDSNATQCGDIPAKILKESIYIYLNELITDIINSSLRTGYFPEELKMGEIFPMYKKKDSLDKANYRPVRILSHLSKVFKRLMYRQIDDYMNDKLSPLLTGLRKNHNTCHCLLTMLEKWRNQLDKGKFIGMMFMNLSKAFDWLES